MKRAAMAASLALALAPAPLFAASTDALPAQVVQIEPAAGLRLRTFFPTLSATVQRADLRSLHLFVDGRDVTQWVTRSGERLQYVPRERIAGGWHDVFLVGMGTDHRPFNDSWAFETLSPEATWIAPINTNFQFLPSGGYAFFPGNFIHFFLLAPSNGFAVLHGCGLGQFQFQHIPLSQIFSVTVPVTQTALASFSNCRIAALYSSFGAFNSTLIPLPVGIVVITYHHGPHLTPVMTMPGPYSARLPVLYPAPRGTVIVHRGVSTGRP